MWIFCFQLTKVENKIRKENSRSKKYKRTMEYHDSHVRKLDPFLTYATTFKSFLLISFFHFFIAFPVFFFFVDNEACIARLEESHEKYMRGLSKFPKFRENWDVIFIRAKVFDRSSQFKIPIDNKLFIEYIIELLIEGADGRRKCFDIIIMLRDYRL